jgi:hypothetical protein
MKICVNGWYFFPELISILAKVDRRHPVCFSTYAGHIHEAMDGVNLVKSNGLRHEIRPVSGLEFGCYDYYLKNIWDGESSVLFMHDDILVGSTETFDTIAELECDQAYIFRDLREEEVNGRIHGRGIFCSRKFLQYALDYVCECDQAVDHEDKHNPGHILKGVGPHNGFWHEPSNARHNQGRVPIGVRHYNTAIYHFQGIHVRFAGRDGLLVNQKVHIWDFESARRGKLGYVRRESNAA